jgi:hypothetical protein
MCHVECPQRNTVLRFLCTHVSASGIVPGSDGEWNRVVWEDSEICIMAETDAVRSALRRILPMTHACSQVKCAKVKDFSSCARSWRFWVGDGRVSSMLDLDDDGCKCVFEVGKEDMIWTRNAGIGKEIR